MADDYAPGGATSVALREGSLARRAAAAEELAQESERPDLDWIVTVYDYLWRPVGELGDFIEQSGDDGRNELPTATIKIKGDDPLIPIFMNCRTTMVGVTIETGGLRFAFYVDTFDYEFSNGAWVGTANLLGIWDILNYLPVYPNWLAPIQAQLFSHAVFIGPVVTCIENMISESALRLQLGISEFLDNLLSLNFDIRSWFGTLLQSNGRLDQALKCPIYVVRTNPFLDTSMLTARTVRFETCAEVLKDMTNPYGIDVRVDLWLTGDAQPDPWANLSQPTYVVTVKDRSQVTGPTKTVLDSVIRTVVDIEGSMLGHVLDPLLNPQGAYSPENVFIAPTLGINFVMPWVLLIAPEPGEPGSVNTCKITAHTPRGWRHIVGGRSPRWLNDLMNVTYAWIIDSIAILVGFSGIPSDLFSGFLNNVFLAFQQIDHYERRNQMGPYHPATEVVHPTASAPYNIETLFAFINALWDSRGWTAVQATFRNGEVYTLGRDVFRGALVSVAYLGRTQLFTDFVERVSWKVDQSTRDIMIQVGDGRAMESPLAKHQKALTGAFEAINVLTLSPQS